MKYLILILTFSAAVFRADSTYAQGGIIDYTFGNGGVALPKIAELDIAYDIKVLSDDKFLLGGRSDNMFVVANSFPTAALTLLLVLTDFVTFQFRISVQEKLLRSSRTVK